MVEMPATYLEWGAEYEEVASARAGRFHFWLVFIACIIYGVASFSITDLRIGHYAFKLMPVTFIATLVFSRANRLALLGFAVPVYFQLKLHQSASSTSDFTMGMSAFLVMSAYLAAVADDWLVREGHVRRPSAMALKGLGGGLLVLGLLGLAKAANVYHWFYQYSSMLGVAAAFALALRSEVNPESIRRMVLGFAGSVFAFQVPFVLRALLQYGPGALGELHTLRAEVGEVALLGSESGLVLIALAFAVGVAASKVPRLLRMRVILFGIAPASAMLLIFLSRGALLTAVGVVALALLISKRRVPALILVVVLGIGTLVFLFYAPEYARSVRGRFESLGGAAALRARIRSEAVGFTLGNPALGLGPGQYRFNTNMGMMSAHNDFLNFAAEQGMIGAIGYIAVVLVLGRKMWRARKVKERFGQGVILGSTLAASGYLVYTQIQPLYWQRGGMLMAGLLGLLYVCSDEGERLAFSQEWEGAPPAYDLPPDTSC